MKETRYLHPLIPADAGNQPLPHRTSVQFGKVWIPASAGMSGCGNSPSQAFRQTTGGATLNGLVRVRPLVGRYNAVYCPDCPPKEPRQELHQ
jgi:hypothetical protein